MRGRCRVDEGSCFCGGGGGGLCFLWCHVRGIYNAEEAEGAAEAAVHDSSNLTLPLQHV